MELFLLSREKIKTVIQKMPKCTKNIEEKIFQLGLLILVRDNSI